MSRLLAASSRAHAAGAGLATAGLLGAERTLRAGAHRGGGGSVAVRDLPMQCLQVASSGADSAEQGRTSGGGGLAGAKRPFSGLG